MHVLYESNFYVEDNKKNVTLQFQILRMGIREILPRASSVSHECVCAVGYYGRFYYVFAILIKIHPNVCHYECLRY